MIKRRVKMVRFLFMRYLRVRMWLSTLLVYGTAFTLRADNSFDFINFLVVI